jgi:hypothetical protein
MLFPSLDDFKTGFLPVARPTCLKTGELLEIPRVNIILLRWRPNIKMYFCACAKYRHKISPDGLFKQYFSKIWALCGASAPGDMTRFVYRPHLLDVVGWFCIPSVRELLANHRRSLKQALGAAEAFVNPYRACATADPLGLARFASALRRA